MCPLACAWKVCTSRGVSGSIVCREHLLLRLLLLLLPLLRLLLLRLPLLRLLLAVLLSTSVIP